MKVVTGLVTNVPSKLMELVSAQSSVLSRLKNLSVQKRVE